jgi:hypothetical protein
VNHGSYRSSDVKGISSIVPSETLLRLIDLFNIRAGSTTSFSRRGELFIPGVFNPQNEIGHRINPRFQKRP